MQKNLLLIRIKGHFNFQTTEHTVWNIQVEGIEQHVLRMNVVIVFRD